MTVCWNPSASRSISSDCWRAFTGPASDALNRSLKPLEAARLVANATDPADRRVRAVLITEEGIGRLREAVPFWRDAQAQIDKAVGIDAGVALNGLLELSYVRLAG